MGEKQIGGRLTPRQMKALMRATDPARLGIFPQKRQRGAGIWSTLASKIAAKAAGKVANTAAKKMAKKMAAKMTKAAAKQVAKKVAKKSGYGSRGRCCWLGGDQSLE